MSAPDDLEQLLAEVRKTINDNSQFLKKLGDETVDEDDRDDEEQGSAEDDFEEL